MVFILPSVGSVSNASQKILKSNQASEAQAKVPVEEPVPTIKDLIKRLSRNDDHVRFNAVRKLSEKDESEVVNPLIECLLKESPTARSCAALALGIIGNPRAIKPLTLTLTFSNPTLYQYSANALSKLLLSKEADSKDIEYAVRILLMGLNRNEVEVRRSAALLLGALGKKEATEVLVECLSDADAETRFTAKELLFKNKDEKTLNLIIKHLREKKNCLGKAEAVQAVGNLAASGITNLEAIDLLIKLLEDEQLVVRCFAIEALGKISDKKVIPYLIKSLEDMDASVRRFACEAFKKKPGLEIVNHLLPLLSDVDPEVAWHAACAIANVEEPDVVVILFKHIINNFENPQVRENISHILNSMKDEIKFKGLVKALNDDDEKVCFLAKLQLGLIKVEQAPSP